MHQAGLEPATKGKPPLPTELLVRAPQTGIEPCIFRYGVRLRLRVIFQPPGSDGARRPFQRLIYRGMKGTSRNRTEIRSHRSDNVTSSVPPRSTMPRFFPRRCAATYQRFLSSISRSAFPQPASLPRLRPRRAGSRQSAGSCVHSGRCRGCTVRGRTGLPAVAAPAR